MTLTIPVQSDFDPLTVLARMSPERRQHFKQSFRRHFAVIAGANTTQLKALATLEKGFNAHYPLYSSSPDGSVQATYAGLTGTVAAQVHPDGTLTLSSKCDDAATQANGD